MRISLHKALSGKPVFVDARTIDTVHPQRTGVTHLIFKSGNALAVQESLSGIIRRIIVYEELRS